MYVDYYFYVDGLLGCVGVGAQLLYSVIIKIVCGREKDEFVVD